MATPLHDPDALSSLSEGPASPAQSWAATRLAIVAPQRFTHFPLWSEGQDVAVAAGPPNLVPALLEALRQETGDTRVDLAATASVLGTYGVLPAQTSAYAEGLRAALRHDGDRGDLWLVHALAIIGEVTRDDLLCAAKVEGAERTWLLPAVVLRLSEQSGEEDAAAAAIARALNREGDPGLLSSLLASLGVALPAQAARCSSPADAATLGALAAGAAPPRLTRRKGSRKRQIQSAVTELLEGISGAGAALLRALFADEVHPAWSLVPVASAAWLASFIPGDPITDVIEREAGTNGRILSAARAAVTPAHRSQLTAALAELGRPTDAVLCMPLIDAGDGALAEQLAQLLNSEHGNDVRLDALASAAAWHCSDAVAALLAQRATRDLGLLLAEWTPTEEVLAALLALPVPADPEPRAQYARCLAAMGESAVVPVLTQLLAQDESDILLPARELAESLLLVPIR